MVFAGAESGLYIGAGIGDSTVEADGTAPEGTYNFSESDSGYKIFGGYNFGIVPLIDIAAEISYVDFGNPSGIFPTNNPINFKLTGYDAFGLVGFSFGPFGLFAKAGVIQWDSDSTIGATNSSDSGSDPAYGIGARFQLSSLAIRAEYEVFDLSGGISDITMLSVSGVFTF
ncbi:MAG: outer membrane beta-barrel protein, partial [Gammaproteobacteria bacterium]